MKIITVTITEDDVKGLAADNDIPELEWGFAIERVMKHAATIKETLTAQAFRMVENVVLVDKIDWDR